MIQSYSIVIDFMTVLIEIGLIIKIMLGYISKTRFPIKLALNKPHYFFSNDRNKKFKVI
jgi:hypothetical protein